MAQKTLADLMNLSGGGSRGGALAQVANPSSLLSMMGAGSGSADGLASAAAKYAAAAKAASAAKGSAPADGGFIDGGTGPNPVGKLPQGWDWIHTASGHWYGAYKRDPAGMRQLAADLDTRDRSAVIDRVAKNNPELKKRIESLEGQSVEKQEKTLADIRKQIGDTKSPAEAEEILRTIIEPAAKNIAREKEAIDRSDDVSAIWDTIRMGGNKILADLLSVSTMFGTSKEKLDHVRALRESNEAIRENNPYLRNKARQEAEGMGMLDRTLSGTGSLIGEAAEMLTPLGTDISEITGAGALGGMVGGLIGSRFGAGKTGAAVGQTVGKAVGGLAGTALGAGVLGRNEFLSDVEANPTLSQETKEAAVSGPEEYGAAALNAGLWTALPAYKTIRGLGRGMSAARIGAMEAGADRAARMAEYEAAYGAADKAADEAARAWNSHGYLNRVARSIPGTAAELGAYTVGGTIGHNALVNSATGEDRDLTEGLGTESAGGVMLNAALFSLLKGRQRALRNPAAATKTAADTANADKPKSELEAMMSPEAKKERTAQLRAPYKDPEFRKRSRVFVNDIANAGEADSGKLSPEYTESIVESIDRFLASGGTYEELEAILESAGTKHNGDTNTHAAHKQLQPSYVDPVKEILQRHKNNSENRAAGTVVEPADSDIVELTDGETPTELDDIVRYGDKAEPVELTDAVKYTDETRKWVEEMIQLPRFKGLTLEQLRDAQAKHHPEDPRVKQVLAVLDDLIAERDAITDAQATPEGVQQDTTPSGVSTLSAEDAADADRLKRTLQFTPNRGEDGKEISNVTGGTKLSDGNWYRSSGLEFRSYSELRRVLSDADIAVLEEQGFISKTGSTNSDGSLQYVVDNEAVYKRWQEIIAKQNAAVRAAEAAKAAPAAQAPAKAAPAAQAPAQAAPAAQAPAKAAPAAQVPAQAAPAAPAPAKAAPAAQVPAQAAPAAPAPAKAAPARRTKPAVAAAPSTEASQADPEAVLLRFAEDRAAKTMADPDNEAAMQQIAALWASGDVEGARALMDELVRKDMEGGANAKDGVPSQKRTAGRGSIEGQDAAVEELGSAGEAQAYSGDNSSDSRVATNPEEALGTAAKAASGKNSRSNSGNKGARSGRTAVQSDGSNQGPETQTVGQGPASVGSGTDGGRSAGSAAKRRAAVRTGSRGNASQTSGSTGTTGNGENASWNPVELRSLIAPSEKNPDFPIGMEHLAYPMEASSFISSARQTIAESPSQSIKWYARTLAGLRALKNYATNPDGTARDGWGVSRSSIAKARTEVRAAMTEAFGVDAMRSVEDMISGKERGTGAKAQEPQSVPSGDLAEEAPKQRRSRKNTAPSTPLSQASKEESAAVLQQIDETDAVTDRLIPADLDDPNAVEAAKRNLKNAAPAAGENEDAFREGKKQAAQILHDATEDLNAPAQTKLADQVISNATEDGSTATLNTGSANSTPESMVRKDGKAVRIIGDSNIEKDLEKRTESGKPSEQPAPVAEDDAARKQAEKARMAAEDEARDFDDAVTAYTDNLLYGAEESMQERGIVMSERGVAKAEELSNKWIAEDLKRANDTVMLETKNGVSEEKANAHAAEGLDSALKQLLQTAAGSGNIDILNGNAESYARLLYIRKMANALTEFRQKGSAVAGSREDIIRGVVAESLNPYRKMLIKSQREAVKALRDSSDFSIITASDKAENRALMVDNMEAEAVATYERRMELYNRWDPNVDGTVKPREVAADSPLRDRLQVMAPDKLMETAGQLQKPMATRLMRVYKDKGLSVTAAKPKTRNFTTSAMDWLADPDNHGSAEFHDFVQDVRDIADTIKAINGHIELGSLTEGKQAKKNIVHITNDYLGFTKDSNVSRTHPLFQETLGKALRGEPILPEEIRDSMSTCIQK